MKRLGSYLRAAWLTFWNIVVNGVTLDRYLPLEGRVRGGVFRNWAGRFRYRPLQFREPETEVEIIAIVRAAKHVRVFGAGHSFNSGIRSDEVLLSLDRYTGVVERETRSNHLIVRAGTRVRDVTRLLNERGLAFSALPSHDAQSIAGILSTDVHGTGRDWGFVSEHVARLRLVDGTGVVHECGPGDDLFRAAIGGIGAVGIVLEVEVRAVERFRVEQRVELADFAFVEKNLDQLLADNDHVSVYLFPFAQRCQINLWNRTDRPRSLLGPLREWLAISFDALAAALLGNALAYLGGLPRWAERAHSVKKGTNLVMESHRAFNRTIYHLHEELEFAVPFHASVDAMRAFMELYESMYHEEPLPYTLFEVRFTPSGHDRTLIGPGREWKATWIDLICCDSHGVERYYQAAERLIKTIEARPHLGKFCEQLDHNDLQRLHATHFQTFRSLAQQHDPKGVFVNGFTARMFDL